jgi:hypothetical protein
MPLPKGERLTTEGVKKLNDEVRKDPKTKREAMSELRERGFRATVEEVFELSDEQRAEMDRTMSPDFEDICRRATLFALERDGKIEFKHAGHNPPNMTAEVYCRGSAGPSIECGVRFEC